MTSPADLVAHARRARDEGRTELALQLYARSAALGLPVAAEHAALLHRCGRRHEALGILDAGVAAEGGRPELLLVRSAVFAALGERARALADLDAALVQRPGWLPALSNRAQLLYGMDRLDEAITDYLRIAELDPRPVEALANAGILEGRRGRHAAAVPLLRRALALAPEHPGVASSLGNALRATGDIDESLRLLAAAEARRPHDPAALTNHASSLLRAKRPAEARERYRRALALDPRDQTALAGLYMAANELGDTATADRLMDYANLLGSSGGEPTGGLSPQALCADVRALRNLAWEPPGRSTRHGEQSAMLDLSDGSPFGAFARVLEHAVERRIAELAGLRSLDSHPWLAARPSRWRLQAWATVLHDQGNQSPHIHPAGWMSGVFYADAGDPVEPGSGAIVFGHPQADLQLSPPAREHRHQPRTGDLLTFPSYFFHHTVPYDGTRPRISLAFDVIPL